jgi:phytoene/squalene synthetase
MTLAACADIVRRGDPDRFLSVMAAAPAARAVLFPLYAFNLEVARAPWVTSEPLIAQMRLQWWRDVLDAIAAGGQVPAHEVARPLAAVLRARAVPLGPLCALVEARRWDIGRTGFAGEEALLAHLDATAGGLLWTAAMALGEDPAREAAVRAAGRAGGVAGWLMAVPALVAQGREPLPDPTPAGVRALAARGLAALRSARQARFAAAVPALRSLWQAGPILAQAAREPGRVAEGTLGLSEFGRRGRLLWKAATGGW